MFLYFVKEILDLNKANLFIFLTGRDLSNNGLTGEIPEFLSRLKFLRVL